LPHEVSLLTEYGVIMKENDTDQPQLCLFSVESIDKPCVAVPWKVQTSIIEANEWLIIKSRECWNDILTTHMESELKKIDLEALRLSYNE
jgi:hypothetical protein